jgi:hypothetical protein
MVSKSKMKEAYKNTVLHSAGRISEFFKTAYGFTYLLSFVVGNI